MFTFSPLQLPSLPRPPQMAAPAGPRHPSGPVSISALAIYFTVVFFLSLPHLSAAGTIKLCNLSSCGGGSGSPYPLLIRFPFRLRGQQDDPRCSYSPAFDVSCDTFGQSIITLPGSGKFTINNIDYRSQTIFLTDPEGCLPRRLLNNTSLITGSSVFRPVIPRNFTLLNCSAEALGSIVYPKVMTVSCLSEGNFTVISVPWRFYDGSHGCQELGSITVPLPMPYWTNVEEDMRLTWDSPDCRSCEERDGICGFKTDNGSSEIGCSSLSGSGLPRAAKYGIILGAGIPGLLGLIALTCFVSGRYRTSQRLTGPSLEFSPIIASQPTFLSIGLDGPTIESYPKTLLGESKRLPKPGDSTCSICLCEYQPKDTLRTIPDCNHYFHVNCIDEWLRLNASCPLCRNLPEPPTQGTHYSSTLSVSTPVSPPA